MTETPTSPSVDGETDIFSIAMHALKVGAPGLSEAIRQGIARSILLRFTALTRPAPSSPALDPVTVERCAREIFIERGGTAEEWEEDKQMEGGAFRVQACRRDAEAFARALIGQPAPSSTVGELDQGNASVASPSNGHPGSVEAPVARALNEVRALIGICEPMGQPLSNVVKRLHVIVHDLSASPPPPDTAVREALEEAVTILRRRAAGYESRATSIFNGRIMADELKGNAREIEALADRLAALPPDAGSRT